MLPTVRLTALLAALALTLAAACGSETGEGNDSSGGSDRAESPSNPDASAVGDGKADMTDLVGRTLVVTEMTLDGAPHAIVDDTQIRFNFGEGRVSVETGCNTMSGSWERDDHTLTFGQMMATMIGCDEARAGQESLLSKALDGPVVVERDTFVAGDLVLVLVDREVVSPDLDLAGRRWHLEALVDDQAVSSVPGGVKAWVEYDGATLTVDTGCNHGRGSATVVGDTLTVEGLGLTRMACQGDRGDVEKLVLAVLGGEVHVQVRERTLTLTGAGGHALVLSADKR